MNEVQSLNVQMFIKCLYFLIQFSEMMTLVLFSHKYDLNEPLLSQRCIEITVVFTRTISTIHPILFECNELSDYVAECLLKFCSFLFKGTSIIVIWIILLCYYSEI